MEVEGIIDKDRLDDCRSVVSAVARLRDVSMNVVRISSQSGGLFNYLLRVETEQSTFFFKQYLDGVSNKTFRLPDIPASSRSRLAYDVQQIACEASQGVLNGAVPAVLFFDRDRNAMLMCGADGDTPLIDLLSTGNTSPLISTVLPRLLAHLHQKTYGVYDADSLFGNRLFRDFKLGLQYDGIAARLDTGEACRVKACREMYMMQSRCVTHGDINSRNILLNRHCLTIIDFEQSHLGTPAYDLAYILCEIFISMMAAGQEGRFSKFLNSFLDAYSAVFKREPRAQLDAELTCHFAVQVIYRFWGPSHRSWTFYVDGASQRRILTLARKLLLSDKPLTEAVLL